MCVGGVAPTGKVAGCTGEVYLALERCYMTAAA